MKQIIDRIAASILGLIVLFIIEGVGTLGMAFRFEEYNWIGYMVQSMFVFLAVWAANKIYDAENPPSNKPIKF
jgi:hypothetical protein